MNRRWGIGVLGTGRGMSYVHAYSHHPDTEVLALCGLDRPRLEAAAAGSGVEGLSLYSDYEEMLRREDIDIIVVASDGTLHAQHSRMALDARKAVLSEVPADYSYEECVRLAEKVEKTGLRYMMAENCLYFPYIPTLKGYIDAGKLGKVVYAESEYVHDVRHIYYRDEQGNHYTREEAQKHPGAKRTWRSGIHPMQYITHSLGPLLYLLDDRCIRVSCLSTGAHTSPEDGNPDAEVAIFQTVRGRVFKILIAHTIAHPGNSWYTLMGTRGSVETTRGSAPRPVVYFEEEGVTHKWREVEWDDFNAPISEEAAASGHGGSDWLTADAFIQGMKSGAMPVDIYRTMDFTIPGICAVHSALNNGASVEIPDFRTDARNEWPEG
ncbi:MAG: Gfo/Idh/MocA family oxidoreductase [Armatimonadetes bacterium]|nr:Gfo/Idh/MocA family oxidoreductase [Armatimonadota bacterium]